ncbi:MAG: hypothetical protein K5681_00650 [Treponema sp.]|nr:hypothetical protein [Treponema sp.]
MDNIKTSSLIAQFLKSQFETFTVKDFYTYLRKHGSKVTKMQVADLLYSSDYVFPLINQEFITRAGVFTGRWFSFAPSKEEIKKNHIILGHRCMPFVNQDVNPDSYQLLSDGKIIESEAQSFSMNQALDTFALFGEGYVIPYILNDKANTSIPLTSVQYNLPLAVDLTSWPLDKLFENQKVEFGDRILCRVSDWNNNIIEVFLQKNDTSGFMVSASAIKREEWYSQVEEALLAGFEKHGPAASIESQLAFLFLENQETLCSKNCGSIEEFIVTSKKVKFQPYGLETRLWNADSVVPYIGNWNNHAKKDLIMSEIAMMFTPSVIDAFIENLLYQESCGKSVPTLNELVDSIFPNVLAEGSLEWKFVLLNLEKRFDILKKAYNSFRDYPVAEIRKRCVDVFSQVSQLLCEIGSSEVSADNFPQQELVVLTQLYGHLARLLEEVENDYTRDLFPADDVALSLEGMEDTFYEIRGILKKAVEDNRSRGYELVTEKE